MRMRVTRVAQFALAAVGVAAHLAAGCGAAHAPILEEPQPASVVAAPAKPQPAPAPKKTVRADPAPVARRDWYAVGVREGTDWAKLVRRRGTSVTDDAILRMADMCTSNHYNRGIRDEPGAEAEYMRGFHDGAVEKW